MLFIEILCDVLFKACFFLSSRHSVGYPESIAARAQTPGQDNAVLQGAQPPEASGSVLRCDSFAVLRIRIRDPVWKNPDSGYGMNIPDHIPESLITLFGLKILKF
jgi:hypothetical protein